MAKLKRIKSKWLVVGDCGHRVYSVHKNRREAESALEVREAYNDMANGWNRLTNRQRDIIQARQRKGR